MLQLKMQSDCFKSVVLLLLGTIAWSESLHGPVGKKLVNGHTCSQYKQPHLCFNNCAHTHPTASGSSWHYKSRHQVPSALKPGSVVNELSSSLSTWNSAGVPVWAVCLSSTETIEISGRHSAISCLLHWLRCEPMELILFCVWSKCWGNMSLGKASRFSHSLRSLDWVLTQTRNRWSSYQRKKYEKGQKITCLACCACSFEF